MVAILQRDVMMEAGVTPITKDARMSGEEKSLRWYDFSLADLNALERELVDGISQLDADPKDLKWIVRAVSKRMTELRVCTRGVQMLERAGVKIVRD